MLDSWCKIYFLLWIGIKNGTKKNWPWRRVGMKANIWITFTKQAGQVSGSFILQMRNWRSYKESYHWWSLGPMLSTVPSTVLHYLVCFSVISGWHPMFRVEEELVWLAQSFIDPKALQGHTWVPDAVFFAAQGKAFIKGIRKMTCWMQVNKIAHG